MKSKRRRDEEEDGYPSPTIASKKKRKHRKSDSEHPNSVYSDEEDNHSITMSPKKEHKSRKSIDSKRDGDDNQSLIISPEKKPKHNKSKHSDSNDSKIIAQQAMSGPLGCHTDNHRPHLPKTDYKSLIQLINQEIKAESKSKPKASQNKNQEVYNNRSDRLSQSSKRSSKSESSDFLLKTESFSESSGFGSQSKSFSGSSDLAKSKTFSECSTDTIIECEVDKCWEIFTSIKEKIGHMAEVHGKVVTFKTCTGCDRTFKDYSKYAKHIITHKHVQTIPKVKSNLEKQLVPKFGDAKCTLCSGTFPSDLLKKHITDDHKMLYPCLTCNRKFLSKDVLKRHCTVKNHSC